MKESYAFVIIYFPVAWQRKSKDKWAYIIYLGIRETETPNIYQAPTMPGTMCVIWFNPCNYTCGMCEVCIIIPLL